MLAARRRFLAAAASTAIAEDPASRGIWAFCAFAFPAPTPLQNHNTAAYGEILAAYTHITSLGVSVGAGLEFCGGRLRCLLRRQFYFSLPALFLAIWALVTVTSRVRFSTIEDRPASGDARHFPARQSRARLSGDQPARRMDRAAISRFFRHWSLFIVRWWQHLPPLRWPARLSLWVLLGVSCASSALIIFGPVLFNPYGLSEEAFYRFYNHTRTSTGFTKTTWTALEATHGFHHRLSRSLESHGRRPQSPAHRSGTGLVR